MLALVITALGVYVLFQRGSALIELFDTDELGSGAIILMQLFDPAYYQVLLNPLPSGNIDVTSGAKALYGIHDGYNEIGYFHLATVMGAFLAALYLSMLLKYTRHFRVFILLVLLHFGFHVLSPLIVYMLVTYSREIHLLLIARAKK